MGAKRARGFPSSEAMLGAVRSLAENEAVARAREDDVDERRHPDDARLLTGILSYCETYGLLDRQDVNGRMRRELRALRDLAAAAERCAAEPGAARRLRTALSAVDRGLPDVEAPDRLTLFLRALAEQVAHSDPWAHLRLIVAQLADETLGPCWCGRRPSDRDLAIIAVLCGWISDAWEPSTMSVADAMESATTAVRVTRRDLGIAPAPRGKPGRPKTRSRTG